MTKSELSDAERAELHSDAISICQTLIRIPSVNYGDGKGDEAAVAAKVVELLLEAPCIMHIMAIIRVKL